MADSNRVNREDNRHAGFDEPESEFDELARSVVRAAIEVHRILGPGYLEAVYDEALAIELALRGMTFERQVPLPLRYKGRTVGNSRLDLLVGGRLVVELKACDALIPVHTAQLLSYLKASREQLGLLINFNVRFLRHGIRRVVATRQRGRTFKEIRG